jgi:hypothetical protein
MSNKNLATVTNELVVSYGNTAKNVINAYRVGNERAVSFVDQSWATAVSKTGTRLSAEVRGNAIAAQKKLSGYYTTGVTLTSDRAEVAVAKAVEFAGKGVEQVAANASRFDKAVGKPAMTTLATAVVPAAVAVSEVAAKLEAQSGALVSKIAGNKVKTAAKKTARRTVATAKKTVRKVKAA